MNISFYTLGCKVNQFETQALGLLLSERGHHICDDFSIADIIIINTCTVTGTSDVKSRRSIRHFVKTYPNAKIAVCGCLAQVNPESIKEIDGVFAICGTNNRQRFIDELEAISKSPKSTYSPDDALKRRSFELLPAGGLCGHTRAMLKVEDGCSNFCTYCIIPYARGPVRSLPVSAALDEARRLSDEGYKEIIITGIEISSYGKDLSPRTDLTELVYLLCKELPDVRFRLGSLEPRTITEDFCVRLSSFTNLCPHFHLSLQSGCDETLTRMRRKYDTARYFESVKLLRSYFPECAITTDIIVGFPSEDEEEFSKTLAFIEKCAFSSIHIFPYSRRSGTPAASMKNQITKAEKSLRVKRSSAIAKRLEEKYLESQQGKILPVLFEELSDGFWCGHTPNYIKVYVKSSKYLKNSSNQVRLLSLFKDGMTGELS